MRRFRAIVLGTVLAFLASWCWADIPPEVVVRAKQATALVEIGEGDAKSEGSAFCIEGTGLFVTNAHVVEPLEVGGKLMLVLRSGEKDQKLVPTHVLALDKEADLAILQTDAPLKLTPLTLGSADNLLETMSIVVRNFGKVMGGRFWLGGYKDTQDPDYGNPASGWHWVTGEPWRYTNWQPNEPNGSRGGAPHSDFLHTLSSGQWNDEQNAPQGDSAQGFLVEFDT